MTTTSRSRTGWQQMERLIRELVGQSDHEAILRLALTDSLSLLQAQRVVVLLEPRKDRPALLAIKERGSNSDVEVLRLPEEGRRPLAPGPRDLVVPLGSPEVGLGTLLASGGPSLGRRRRRQLATALAHVITVAVTAERALASERRVADDLHDRAWRDELTGLGTRALLTRRANRCLALSVARHRRSALLLLDLDDFKGINDTLGHDAGDRVLAEVGRRVSGQVRATDIAVRLGGDEFAILAGELASPDDGAVLAERLLRALDAPMRIDDVELRLGGSVGVAVHGEDGDSLDDLLRAADEAMYQAKQAGRAQWRRYRMSDSGRSDRAHILLPDLGAGIPEGELLVNYQPQIEALTGRPVGFEALVWWQHPLHGRLAAEEFVPEVERRGLSRALIRSVLVRALDDLGRLQSFAPDASMALNVSARHLLSRGLVVDLRHALAGSGCSPDDLVLEMTEPAGGSSPTVSAVLDAIRELGCHVSVHRFGTAQSSLTAISHHAAIREVKVDPVLASAVLEDPAHERLVRGLVGAAHGLDLRVVAEGVDSVELRAALTGLGCDRLQGAVIHQPASVEVVADWLAKTQGEQLSPAASLSII